MGASPLIHSLICFIYVYFGQFFSPNGGKYSKKVSMFPPFSEKARLAGDKKFPDDFSPLLATPNFSPKPPICGKNVENCRKWVKISTFFSQ